MIFFLFFFFSRILFCLFRSFKFIFLTKNQRNRGIEKKQKIFPPVLKNKLVPEKYPLPIFGPKSLHSAILTIKKLIGSVFIKKSTARTQKNIFRDYEETIQINKMKPSSSVVFNETLAPF